MSKAIVALFLFAGLVAISSGYLCPPDFCKVITCPKITEENCHALHAMKVPRGSICGCCDVCISLPYFKPEAPGDVPEKLCPLPYIGTGEQGYYPC